MSALSNWLFAFLRPNAAMAAKDAEIKRLKMIIANCDWYWPAEDTSSDAYGGHPGEILENLPAGEVHAVSRGGVVETRFYAVLPPADDADSDDEFEVDEATELEALIRLKSEIDRRAEMTKGAEAP